MTVQIRYNNCDRAAMDQSVLRPYPQVGGVSTNSVRNSRWTFDDVYDALQQWSTILNSPSSALKFQMQPGEMVVLNNRRLLHARTEFEGDRHVAGAYVGQEEWQARRRFIVAQQARNCAL